MLLHLSNGLLLVLLVGDLLSMFRQPAFWILAASFASLVSIVVAICRIGA